jgi:hypothetical protein
LIGLEKNTKKFLNKLINALQRRWQYDSAVNFLPVYVINSHGFLAFIN